MEWRDCPRPCLPGLLFVVCSFSLHLSIPEISLRNTTLKRLNYYEMCLFVFPDHFTKKE